MNCTKSPEKTISSAMAPKPIDLPVLDRWLRLVNNDQFADVAFRVGEVEELMFGHKAVLAGASEVCSAQFAGSFRESRDDVLKQPIPIVDLEPAIFKELLRYMYSDRAWLSLANVVDIYYGADKYLLVGLKKTCMQFLLESLTLENVLGLFDRNRRHELGSVNRVCLDIICENPLNVFANEAFVTLAAKSVELIVSQQAINCQTDQLLTAIRKWVNANKDKLEEGAKITNMVREQKTRGLLCKKMYNFSGGFYSVDTAQICSHGFNRGLNSNQICYFCANPSSPIDTNFMLKISAEGQFTIYGVGICIKSMQAEERIPLDVIVTCNKRQIDATQRTVTAKEDISIEEVLFEKQTIDHFFKLDISIHMRHENGPVYCLKSFEPENSGIKLRFTSSCEWIPSSYRPSGTECCVAYVLYNPGWGVDLKQRKAEDY